MAKDKERSVKKYELDTILAELKANKQLLLQIDSKLNEKATHKELDDLRKDLNQKIRYEIKGVYDHYEPIVALMKWLAAAVIIQILAIVGQLLMGRLM